MSASQSVPTTFVFRLTNDCEVESEIKDVDKNTTAGMMEYLHRRVHSLIAKEYDIDRAFIDERHYFITQLFNFSNKIRSEPAIHPKMEPTLRIMREMLCEQAIDWITNTLGSDPVAEPAKHEFQRLLARNKNSSQTNTIAAPPPGNHSLRRMPTQLATRLANARSNTRSSSSSSSHPLSVKDIDNMTREALDALYSAPSFNTNTKAANPTIFSKVRAQFISDEKTAETSQRTPSIREKNKRKLPDNSSISSSSRSHSNSSSLNPNAKIKSSHYTITRRSSEIKKQEKEEMLSHLLFRKSSSTLYSTSLTPPEPALENSSDDSQATRILDDTTPTPPIEQQASSQNSRGRTPHPRRSPRLMTPTPEQQPEQLLSQNSNTEEQSMLIMPPRRYPLRFTTSIPVQQPTGQPSSQQANSVGDELIPLPPPRHSLRPGG